MNSLRLFNFFSSRYYSVSLFKRVNLSLSFLKDDFNFLREAKVDDSAGSSIKISKYDARLTGGKVKSAVTRGMTEDALLRLRR